MAKRKAKRTTKRKEKRSRKEGAQQKERLGLYSLPDHLIKEILLWTRPNDEDPYKSIWKWVCQMSATCVAFRRIILSPIKPGVAPMTPVILDLGRYDESCKNSMLINTIIQSDWMDTDIKSVVKKYGVNCLTADALRSLLTTSGKLPNLKEVHLDTRADTFSRSPFIDDKSFLRKLTKEHPGLTTLCLARGVLGNERKDYLSARTFASPAASLPHLERFEIHEVAWMESNHLVAFFSNVGPKLMSLKLYEAYGFAFTEEVYASIATNCHNLVTLQLKQCFIPSRHFDNILRSNTNLLHLDVRDSDWRDDPELFFDTIVEHIPRLESFDGSWCNWVDDNGIMRLINGQIKAYGRIFLTELVIKESARVSIEGVRSFLIRWRESSPVLPLEVRTSWYEDDQEAMVALANDFPEVVFR